MSRFRVRNGMEKDVERAFLNRPHIVDTAPGFLGMETFTDADDPTIFYLVTRWTDAESFRAWHASPAHRHAHAGIPKGLKLDPAFTQVTILSRLADPNGPVLWEEIAADTAPLLARHIATGTRTLHCVVADTSGLVRASNAAAVAGFGEEHCSIGSSLWARMVASDADRLRQRVSSGEANTDDRLLLNFLDGQGNPFTLECRVIVQPSGFIVIGEPPHQDTRQLEEQLHQLNNELAVMLRESERKSKALVSASTALRETLEDVQESYRELSEVQTERFGRDTATLPVQ